jgi:hypothetical protein
MVSLTFAVFQFMTIPVHPIVSQPFGYVIALLVTVGLFLSTVIDSNLF